MRGNKSPSIAQSKKYVVIPKKQFEKFLKIQAGWAKSTIGLKRDMRKLVAEEVTRQVGDKIHMIESALDGVIALRTIFKKKGHITQEEYNEEKAKMRKKK